MDATDDGIVYFVTEESRAAGQTTLEAAAGAIEGGVDIIQLREKEMSASERYELGTELRELTAGTGVDLIVNDRVDIAVAIDADGVHLGDSDLPVTVAREQLGNDAIIGRSVSTPEGAQDAEEAGADYLGVGAVYKTDSKDVPQEHHGIGSAGIEAVSEATDLPVIGIGGVTAKRTPDVMAAGADGVAVISAISRADDPKQATRELRDAVNGVIA